jgi:hypothetical protein
LLEHIVDWRLAVNNMKMMLKRTGYIYITTRSRGFLYHGFPWDFWRYAVEDMGRIFMDFEVIAQKKDHQAPGVFLKARKPENYVPADLSDIALYSMVLGRRTRDIPNIEDMPFSRSFMLRLLRPKVRWLLERAYLMLM